MLRRKKAAGLTLVELMIALAINGILFTALLTIFSANVEHYHKSIELNRLNQSLQAAMNIMVSDIRRAGYWSNATSDVGTGQNNNPFMVSGTDISVNAGANCILFTYDYDKNGTLASISSTTEDERYGFRLSNQAVQARTPGSAFDCNASASAWENLTDPNIVQITNLSFTLSTSTITTGPGTKGIQFRSVDITLAGRLAKDNTVTKTLTQHVRIRNDKFIP